MLHIIQSFCFENFQINSKLLNDPDPSLISQIGNITLSFGYKMVMNFRNVFETWFFRYWKIFFCPSSKKSLNSRFLITLFWLRKITISQPIFYQNSSIFSICRKSNFSKSKIFFYIFCSHGYSWNWANSKKKTFNLKLRIFYHFEFWIEY